MGIALNAVYQLSRMLPDVALRPSQNVLTLGVQDCYFTQAQLQAFLVKHQLPHADVPEGEVELTAGFRHLSGPGREPYLKNTHQRTLFQNLGYHPRRVQGLDVSDFEGAEYVHDLNLPVPAAWHGQFDFIFDGGTVEHVFSIKEAFYNLARLCRVGGVCAHFSPTDLINHGFINLNYHIFQDFYSRNGFECVQMKYVAVPCDTAEADQYLLEIEPEALRFPVYGYRLYTCCAFRKTSVQELQIPTQGFYRELYEKIARDAQAPAEPPPPPPPAPPPPVAPPPARRSMWKKLKRALGITPAKTPPASPPAPPPPPWAQMPPHVRVEL
ncbi:MAG TPA: hypothetical protein VK737_08640 [Opitutales bacterium]|jgi:hypothetical protein|nr:hypothetical protein [Opitutales bacterium]